MRTSFCKYMLATAFQKRFVAVNVKTHVNAHVRTYSLKSRDFKKGKQFIGSFSMFLLPEAFENGCFDKVPLICIYPFQTMFNCSLYQLKPSQANAENCRFLFGGFYCTWRLKPPRQLEKFEIN